MQITKIETFKQAVTLKKPFTVSFATLQELETIIVKVTTDSGIVGYGEAAPFEPVTAESIATELPVLQLFAEKLKGADPCSIEDIHARMDQVILGHTAAKAGIDIACYDILGKQAGLPLYKLLGGSSNSIESDYTLGIDSTDKMVAEAKKYVAAGFKILKVKVGLDDRHDVEVVRAIRQAVGPDVELRIDANQAWTPKQTIRLMRQFSDMVSAVEQPLSAERGDGLPFVRAHVEQPVMADESVHNAFDAYKLLAAEGADIVNIKLQKSSGLYGAQQINAVAEAAGAPVMLGCMVETRISLTAAVHFVAAHRNARYADLDAFMDFKEPSWLRGGFTQDGGTYTLTDAPGLGIECDL
ncbi:mandelate racemase/muconate lactonizing enzyme family protein [Lacticaseibacillus zhaodongensis]|uniref:mandelate racemase/muconate lactonizing enzyme family protein n=1 Tax=Lacticaseibacillus zhaodongensis TaxID=2668065 RepID=UPI0012D2A8B3|nr:dipeptide epimerase [Lacticaseibacillus zhaodongensis]